MLQHNKNIFRGHNIVEHYYYHNVFNNHCCCAYFKITTKIIKSFVFFLYFSIIACLYACSSEIPNKRVREIDELNNQAYRCHYISLDSVEFYANKALEIEKEYNYQDGKYEAMCNIAFAKYMRLDYIPAQNTLNNVIYNADNTLYKLVADVIMMRICQRRSENEDFFIYYNEALDNMKRIEQDIEDMTDRQKKIWNFAISEFKFANSVYNYYTRQDQKEEEDLTFVLNNFNIVENDSAQTAMLYFLLGNQRAVDRERPYENIKYLIQAAALAKNARLNYILAKALASISEDLAKENNYKPEDILFIKNYLVDANDSTDNKQLPLLIANIALEDFKEYGSPFDVSQTYIAIADYYIQMKDGQQALDNMKMALECINLHHKIVEDDGIILSPEFKPNYTDSLSIEQKWIRNGVVCVPEWIMDVREHLSIAYALVGSKVDCMFNRNVYIDLLKETRQDSKMQIVLNKLQNEQKDLNKYMIYALIIVLLLIATAYLLARRIRQNFIKNYLKEKSAVEQEMKRWREKSDIDFSSLEEKQEIISAEKISNEKRLEEQKRQYINKTTCLAIVYAITPFLDRAVNQVAKIKEQVEKMDNTSMDENIISNINEKLLYINELIQRINLYNDILANWIKIRQGEVALNVEKFELEPLFKIMEGNNRTFLAKGLTLKVEHTDIMVKADRALTLFMINTLLDNARKYSQRGGEVKLYTREEDDFVDIVVEDSGRGMSQKDVNTILQEKVYDSSKIGEQNDQELKNNKGFGFGLLNCKGIIEKYKKTSRAFSVCKFGIESILGKGSKFYFRLPIITKKILVLILAFASFHCIIRANESADTKDSLELYQLSANDSVHQRASNYPDDPIIQKANEYAYYAYQANIHNQWDWTLIYADSACQKLNEYYIKKENNPRFLIKLFDENNKPDIDLWNSGFETDYFTIIDIRNEAAIAALATNDIKLYTYNNEIYHRLYKLTTSDPLLEKRCVDTRQTIINHKTLFYVLILIVILGILIFFFVYYHKNMVPTFELRQILELNRRIFNNEDEEMLADIILNGMDNIRKTDGVIVMTRKDKIIVSKGCPQFEYIVPILKDASANKEKYIIDNGKNRIYPLIVDNDKCIGAIAFIMHNTNDVNEDDKLFSMIAQYTAINIFYAKVRMEKINDDIEIMQDEKRKTEREGNIVHVQNLVIDNTLSTIKHETMYYPNRIKQIADKMAEDCNLSNSKKNKEYVQNMYELITYYKDVFTILADCTAKQIVKPMFRRKNISVEYAIKIIEKSVNRYNRNYQADITINNISKNDINNERIVVDETMFVYLIDNVIEAALNEAKHGSLLCDFDKSEDFIKFVFQFDNNNIKTEDLKKIFYPEALRYNEECDKLTGAQMLIAKQIIREHDEHVRRGCRISAQHKNNDKTGIIISFTIPENRFNINNIA